MRITLSILLYICCNSYSVQLLIARIFNEHDSLRALNSDFIHIQWDFILRYYSRLLYFMMKK